MLIFLLCLFFALVVQGNEVKTLWKQVVCLIRVWIRIFLYENKSISDGLIDWLVDNCMSATSERVGTRETGRCSCFTPVGV